VGVLRKQLAAAQAEAVKPHRRRLPRERAAITHKFDIAGHEGYITVGLYQDGQPGEIFLKMAKEGSTVSGLMDTVATLTSVALQYGVPLRDLIGKFAHVRFEPAGFTGNGEIPIAKSIIDYVFRWLGSRFLPGEEKAGLGLIDGSAAPATTVAQLSFGPSHPANYRPDDPRGVDSPGLAARLWADPPAPSACALKLPPGDGVTRPGQGRLHHPGGRPQLRRMRLDHGPQRQLLQVPQLREHERLQLKGGRHELAPEVQAPNRRC
jgi:hypothetical protein